MTEEKPERTFRMKVTIEATVDADGESAREVKDWLEDELSDLACLHTDAGEVTFDLQDYSIGRALLVKKEG